MAGHTFQKACRAEMSLLTLIRVVEAVSDARNRIPLKYRGIVTFFSEYDLWLFESERDQKVCVPCDVFDGGVFQGTDLRTLFPYFEIVNENEIAANVHPNCRCKFTRSNQRLEEEQKT